MSGDKFGSSRFHLQLGSSKREKARKASLRERGQTSGRLSPQTKGGEKGEKKGEFRWYLWSRLHLGPNCPEKWARGSYESRETVLGLCTFICEAHRVSLSIKKKKYEGGNVPTHRMSSQNKKLFQQKGKKNEDNGGREAKGNHFFEYREVII